MEFFFVTCHFYKRQNWGSIQERHLSNISVIIGIRAGVWIQGGQCQSPCFFLYTLSFSLGTTPFLIHLSIVQPTVSSLFKSPVSHLRVCLHVSAPHCSAWRERRRFLSKGDSPTLLTSRFLFHPCLPAIFYLLLSFIFSSLALLIPCISSKTYISLVSFLFNPQTSSLLIFSHWECHPVPGFLFGWNPNLSLQSWPLSQAPDPSDKLPVGYLVKYYLNVPEMELMSPSSNLPNSPSLLVRRENLYCPLSFTLSIHSGPVTW